MKKKTWSKFIGILLCVCVMFSLIGVKGERVLAEESDFDYYQQLKTNGDEYRKWKENLLKSGGRRDTKGLAQRATSISNNYIEFNTRADGRFTIGTVEGNPNINTDNYQALLYGHPAGASSYTTVRVNGKSNIFNPTDVVYNNEKLESVAVTEYDGIQVVQTLSIIENESTNREDVVRISYNLKNTSNSVKDVGLRIMMDTMLGANDAAPFRVNGLNITKETELSGEDIPQAWMAFDSISKSGVVSQGTLFKNEDETKPDKVQFVNWKNVFGASWNYVTNSSLSNDDSAVTMRWDEKPLAAGESFTYYTYYGLSELTYDLVPPVALGVYLDKNSVQYQGSFYQINATAYIQNIGSGNAKDVKLWIETDDNFKLDSKSNAKEIAVMKTGESNECSWTLKVNRDGTVAEDTVGTAKIKLQYTEESTGKVGNKEIVKNIRICKNNAEKQAIIIIPGCMGSCLQNEDGKTLWAGPATLIKHTELECDQYGNSRYPISAVASGYGTIDIYETLYKELEKCYGDNYDVVFAPYDWRLGIDKNAAEVKQYIDRYDRVAVVAHSMGGLVLEKYVHDYGAHKIMKAVTVGTPFWGSIMAARVEYDGYIELAKGLGGNFIEELVHNFEGVHSLLPNSYYTDCHNWCSVTTNQYETFWDYITCANHKTELKDWNGTKEFYKEYCNEYLFNQASDKLNQLHVINSCDLDKANTTYIVGNGVVTDSDADFFDGLVASESGAIPMMVSYGKSNHYGDGTVSMISSTMNRIDASLLNHDKVQYLGNFVVIRDVGHIDLVKQDISIDEIKKALKESVIPDSSPTITKPQSKSRLAGAQKSSSMSSEDYEDTSMVVQLILTGDLDIDMYNQSELTYYYHQDSENPVKEGADFIVHRAGVLGGQKIVIASFTKDAYMIKLTSKKNQVSQIGILNEQNLQSLSDFSLSDGDVVEIQYSPEKSFVSYNGKQIKFDGNDSLSVNDVSIMSMDTCREEEGNTIGARIKMKNCGDKNILLDGITLGYTFNPDGFKNNVAEFDWVSNNHVDITRTAHGSFTSLANGNMQLNITFDNGQVLEAGNELEIHFRIHTTDWRRYNLTNDYSRNTAEYSANERIMFWYQNELICGKEYHDGESSR